MTETRVGAGLAGDSTVAVIGAWRFLTIVRNTSAGIADGFGPAVKSLAFGI
jgi:hypothetical protein